MIMNNEKIWEKLDSMYADKKSQKFIDHLIKSYLPKNKLEKVVEVPKGRFRCAITNFNLVAIDDVYAEIGDNPKKRNQFIDFVNTMLNDDGIVVTPPRVPILNRKSVALTGENTDTFLRYETFIAFFAWVEKKIVEGDKHIYWLIKQMQAEDDFTIMRVTECGLEGEKIKFVKKNPKKKSTFADLDVLHELKAQLKKEERR